MITVQAIHRKDGNVCTTAGMRPIRLAHLPWTPAEMRSMIAWPDTECGRAVEDRDLLTEAHSTDACLATAAETLLTLYPSTDTSSLYADGVKRHTLAN